MEVFFLDFVLLIYYIIFDLSEFFLTLAGHVPYLFDDFRLSDVLVVIGLSNVVPYNGVISTIGGNFDHFG